MPLHRTVHTSHAAHPPMLASSSQTLLEPAVVMHQWTTFARKFPPQHQCDEGAEEIDNHYPAK